MSKITSIPWVTYHSLVLQLKSYRHSNVRTVNVSCLQDEIPGKSIYQVSRRVLSRSVHVTASPSPIGAFQMYRQTSLARFEPLQDCGQFKRVCLNISAAVVLHHTLWRAGHVQVRTLLILPQPRPDKGSATCGGGWRRREKESEPSGSAAARKPSSATWYQLS